LQGIFAIELISVFYITSHDAKNPILAKDPAGQEGFEKCFCPHADCRKGSKSVSTPMQIAGRVRKMFLSPCRLQEGFEKCFYPHADCRKGSKNVSAPMQIAGRVRKVFLPPCKVAGRVRKVFKDHFYRNFTKKQVFSPSNKENH